MDVTCTCGTTFQARHPRAKYCSDRCRKRPQRAGKVVVDLADTRPELGVAHGPVEKATVRELDDAGRLDSALGQTCLALARRLDAPGVDTGSALASLAGRLEQTLAAATKGAGKQTAPGQLRDEVAERRRQRGA